MRTITAALLLAAAILTGCRTVGPTRPGLINHVVFFQLNDPADATELIADCDRELATIPGVTGYYCGTHLDTGRGDRVDGDYDVGFFVSFDSEEAYSRYVAHPQHVWLVEKWGPEFESLRIYDVLDETP